MTWRRVKRLIWLAAWSFWAFIGWRLYVEFPRTLGEPLYSFDTRTSGSFTICFDPATQKSVLVWDESIPDGSTETLRALDLTDGREFAPWTQNSDEIGMRYWIEDAEFATPDLALAKTHPIHVYTSEKVGERDRVLSRDLETGRERVLPIAELDRNDSPNVSRCDVLPWVALQGRLPGDNKLLEPGEWRTLLVDLKSGTLLRSWPPPNEKLQPGEIYTHPKFVTGSCDLALERKRDVGQDSESCDVEIWRPPFADEPDFVWRKPSARDFGMRYSQNGRVAVGGVFSIGDDYISSIDVYDLASGARLFAQPPISERTNYLSCADLSAPDLWCSQDGRTVLFDDEAVDVDTGKALWKVGKGERIIGFANDTAMVFESWGDDSFLGRSVGLAAAVAFDLPRDADGSTRTISLRDVRSGALLCRSNELYGPDVGKGRFAIGYDRSGVQTNIYECTPRVPWRRLALIQAFLALPLLLVYSYRWWGWRRRKRS